MIDVLKSAVGYFRNLVRRCGGDLWAALALAIIVTMTEGVGVLLLLPLLEVAGVATSGAGVGRITDFFHRLLGFIGLEPTLAPVLVVFFVIVVAHELASWGRRIVDVRLLTNLATGLRGDLFASIARSRWAFLSRERGAGLTKALTNDIERTVVATNALQHGFAAVTIVAVYVGISFTLSPQVTLLVAGTGGLLWLGVARKTAGSRDIGRDIVARYESLFGVAGELVGAMKTIKADGRIEASIGKFERANRRLARRHVAEGRFQAWAELAFKVGAAAAVCLIVYSAVAVFTIATPSLLLLLFLFARIIPKLALVSSSWFQFVSHLQSFDEIEKVIARCRSHREDPVEPDPVDTGPPTVVVDELSFAHQAGNRILDRVSLRVPSGSLVAVYGESGSGKTTLLDLIMGLLTPDAGTIRIGPHEEASKRRAWLMRWASYVGQETAWFNATVRENLLWPADAVSDERVDAVLHEVGADFVHDLPTGLDTEVGDRGVLLSGGERQRLDFARALLREPRLLLLDEATSALDADSERRLLASIAARRPAMTILMVSHRPAAVKLADIVFRLHRGRLSEERKKTSLPAEAESVS